MAFPLLQVGTQLISQSPIPSTGPLPVMEHFQHRYCVSHVKTDHSVSVRRVLESYESVVIQGWWPDSRRVTDVDEQEPRTLRPQQVAISERSDRRRMEAGRTFDPAWQARRRQADGDPA